LRFQALAQIVTLVPIYGKPKAKPSTSLKALTIADSMWRAENETLGERSKSETLRERISIIEISLESSMISSTYVLCPIFITTLLGKSYKNWRFCNDFKGLQRFFSLPTCLLSSKKLTNIICKPSKSLIF